ncbi:MAG: sugar phosphate isomerase/epimerase [Mariniblastus sp.]|nr:sugar phosphate isomerase/epimerase [Mariniblastus sp.]
MDNTNQSDQRFDRRGFLGASAAALAGSAFLPCLSNPLFAAASPKNLPFKISLAEWSLHKSINGKKISNLDFPRVAKEEFGINAIEYVNQFFKTEVDDPKYMTELKQRCSDQGVQSLLIMVDGEGRLGDPNEKKRMKAVENHRRWLRAAKELGCHSIRVNAGSQGSYEEQVKLAADGLSRLSEMATEFCQNVIVENHGGLSSNGAWLAEVIQTVNMKNCGTLPDFGNFKVSKDEWYDRYKGVKELMPYAKAVSAKSHHFDDDGNEVSTDYFQMMKIVLDAGYRGYVGIEFEGGGDEYAGVHATKKLLERCQDKFACMARSTSTRRRRWLPRLRNHLNR